MLDWLVECLAGPGVNYRDCGHGQISQRDFHSFRNQNHDIMNSTQGLSIRTIGLNCPLLVKPWTRAALRFSSSNARWKQRQGKDAYARDAKVQGLKSRAAFKLLEVGLYFGKLYAHSSNIDQMDAKYRLFKPGNVVVDLVNYFSSRYSESTTNSSAGLRSWKLVSGNFVNINQSLGLSDHVGCSGPYATQRQSCRHRLDPSRAAQRRRHISRRFPFTNGPKDGEGFYISGSSSLSQAEWIRASRGRQPRRRR